MANKAKVSSRRGTARSGETSGQPGKSAAKSAAKSAGRSGKSQGKVQSRTEGQSRGGSSGGAQLARSAAPASSEVDALEVLKAQHREVESLFNQFERTENDNESFELAQVICQKLTVHATIEEELLYPLARSRAEQSDSDSELKDLVLESLEEHRSAKRLIGDIQAADVGDETLEAKISVLKEQVTHHVDEEEDDLFPQLKKGMSKDERLELGQSLQARADELEAADAEVEVAEPEETDDEQAGSPNGSMGESAQKGAGRHPRAPAQPH